MRIGYVRVSTENQHTDRQDVIMEKLKVDKVYLEKVSGRSIENRPQLKDMISFAREGDVIVSESISRLARNTKDFLEIIEKLRQKKLEIELVNEKIITTGPQGQLVMTILSAIAQFEIEVNALRQRGGIEEAKKRGAYKGRQKIKIDTNEFIKVCDSWKAGHITATMAIKILGLKRNTFYRNVKEIYNNSKKI